MTPIIFHFLPLIFHILPLLCFKLPLAHTILRNILHYVVAIINIKIAHILSDCFVLIFVFYMLKNTLVNLDFCINRE